MARFKQFISESPVQKLPVDNKERQELLKSKIEAGEQVDVRDAAYVRGEFSFGDLRALGWAEKEQEPAGGGEVDEWWVYTGPGEIKCDGQVMRKGNTTPKVRIDYADHDYGHKGVDGED